MNNNKSVYKALATFQEKVPKIDLDGEVKTKAYSFKYATLANIIQKIKPAMKEAGLGFTQLIEGSNLRTVLFSAEDGSTVESVLPINVTGDPKNVGALITYYKRYALCGALGIAAEEDKDAPQQAGKDPLNDRMLNKALGRIAEGEPEVLEQVLQHFEVTAKQVRELVKAEGDVVSE